MSHRNRHNVHVAQWWRRDRRGWPGTAWASAAAVSIAMVCTPSAACAAIKARVQAPNSVVRGDAVRITGQISGFRGTITVVLQRRLNGRWLTRGSRKRLRGPGRFSIAWTVSTPAQQLTLRVGVRRGGRLVLSSTAFRVRVRGRARPTSPPPIVDTTPPNTTITSAPVGLVSANAVTIGYTSSEAGSSFQCRLDGAPWTACGASDATYVALTPGLHSFAVMATDGAGNPDPDPATVEWRQLAADQVRCNISQAKSTPGGTATTIQFVNQSSGIVDLHWLDYDGDPIFYGFIFPGTTLVQSTYTMQPWIVMDEADRCIGFTIAESNSQTYVIAPGA